MQVSKRTVAFLFVTLFGVVAAVASPLIAAYLSAFLALAVIRGLMGYSASVALRKWRLELPSRYREAAESAELLERRAA